MAITFTDVIYLDTSNNQVLFDNQTSASLSFFFRYETSGLTTTSALGATDIISRAGENSICARIEGSSTPNKLNLRVHVRGPNGDNTRLVLIDQGVSYHVAVTHQPGAQTLWLNGIPTIFGTGTYATNTLNNRFYIGGSPPGSPVVFTVGDVILWNGYVLLPTEVADLRDGADASTIGTSATLRARWTLAGTSSITPQLGDSGLANTFGDTTYDLTSIGGTGSIVYTDPLSVQASVGIQNAYVGTSGKTVVVFFKSLVTSLLAMPVLSYIIPTISKNGQSLGSLSDPWLTGYHECVVYRFPNGTSALPGDTITLSAPTGWMVTSSGLSKSENDLPISNFTGRSAVGTDSLRKTFKPGLNFPHLGTSAGSQYQIPKNWRYRFGPFSNGNDTPDGKPTAGMGGWGANICDTNGTNGIDATGYPGISGLYALSWDDLNPSSPTTFACWADAFSDLMSITERTDLANPGDINGVGKARVFDVQRATGLTTGRMLFDINVSNATNAPLFDNLYIYGPGDFTYQDNNPVVLDRSDPYALSNVFLDRIQNGTGSTRWLDSTLSFGGTTNLSEPEELRLLTDFSWGDGNHKYFYLFMYDRVQPFNPTGAYLYSTFFGSPYTATLASSIDSVTTTLTISDAATAPVIVGLTLTIDSEIMRVINVSDTTVTVSRGSANTVSAPHASGTINVNNRMAVTGLSMFGSSGNGRHSSQVQVVEYVTQQPHRLKSGCYVDVNGTLPTFTFTNGTSFDPNGFRTVILVTGANSFVVPWFINNPGTGATTLIGTTDLSASNIYTYTSLSDMGFPYDFIALTTGKISGCDLHVNLSILASDTLVDTVARLIRDNFPPGRTVWIELYDEPWNFLLGANWWSVVWLSEFNLSGQTVYYWTVLRTYQMRQRFIDRFNENGHNRGNEIKCMINVQAVIPNQSYEVLQIAQSLNATIDAIAIAPYVESDNSAVSIAAFNVADDEQAIDLWIHDLYYNKNVSDGWTFWIGGHKYNINSYNTATGNNCVLYGYEGGIQIAIPSSANYVLERTRDMVYNPNWWIAEQDFYAFLQLSGFHRLELYAYDMQYVGWNNWGVYHSIFQDHGRGDGSDGKADNRLCLATPGRPNTKSPTINQDVQNISVRGQALIDWMRSTLPPRKPKSFLRRQH